jgi:hemoglobin
MADNDERTLYDRIGGEEAVAGLLAAFYQRVLGDPELRPFFEGMALDKLRTMQAEFFSAALEGPIRYTGRPLSAVHAGLGIQPRHVRLFLEHLLETLEGAGLSEQDRYDTYSRIATRADEVTGITSVDG